MLEDLNDLIDSNPGARELKRAVAVQMFLKGYKHREIGESFGVSSGFTLQMDWDLQTVGSIWVETGVSRLSRLSRTGTTAGGAELVKAQKLLESGPVASAH